MMLDIVQRVARGRLKDLFLQEGAKDKAALKVAKKTLGKDKRPAAQKIAERFLKNDDYLEWQLDMPEAQISKLNNTTLVFCPGLINGLLPGRAFCTEFPEIEEEYRSQGWKIFRADAHPMRGCEANNKTCCALSTRAKGSKRMPAAVLKRKNVRALPPRTSF